MGNVGVLAFGRCPFRASTSVPLPVPEELADSGIAQSLVPNRSTSLGVAHPPSGPAPSSNDASCVWVGALLAPWSVASWQLRCSTVHQALALYPTFTGLQLQGTQAAQS